MTSLNPLNSGISPLRPSEPDALSGSGHTQRGIAPNLTILGSSLGIEGPGSARLLPLDPARASLQSLPLNELVQQIESIGRVPLAPLMFGAAVDALAHAARGLGEALRASPPPEPAVAAELAGTLEDQATVLQRSLRDIIENSTYPNFSDFLKELVRISQELRERATEAKLASIEANYQLMYQAAEKMLEAANLAKESRDKQIEAERKEAIGQIISGAFSIVLAFAVGPQIAAGLGQATSGIINGSFSLAASSDKSESSALQLKSDLANVAKTLLEAAAKLIEQQTQIAEDLREIAKGLREMILKLYQDFISAQSQTIQRANV